MTKLFSKHDEHQHDDTELTRPTICHVLHTLDVGGAELLAQRFAVQASHRFRPVFVCLDSLGTLGEQLRGDGFEVEVVHRRPGFDFQCAMRMATFFRTQKVKLVHAHQYGPFFYASLSRLRGGRFPILFTEHGRDYPDYRRPKRVLANRFLLRRADRVVAVGNYVKSALEKNEGISSDRIEVIYNGVDSGKFESRDCSREKLRAALEVGESQVAIVQVARLNRLKDFGTALRAMAQVCQACPQAVYFIVGEGEEQESIENQIQELGLQQRVKMLGLRNDVPQLLQAMDVFLLSSISEGIPLTLIEAMFAKLPCVATDVGGVAEVVSDQKTGLLVPAQDDASLAQEIQHLVQSRLLRMQLGSNGQRRADILFQANLMQKKYERLYEKMIGQDSMVLDSIVPLTAPPTDQHLREELHKHVNPLRSAGSIANQP